MGSTGPSGGLIFYVDRTRPAGSKYFEVACAGWSDGTCGGNDLIDPRAPWGCRGTSINGAQNFAIGTGEQNTDSIVNGCGDEGVAAKVAQDLVLGGNSDWFLPSKDELNQLFVQKAGIERFSGAYWSSSEHDANNAWWQMGDTQLNIGCDGTTCDNKIIPDGSIRPVRTF